ncbi:zinc finger protein 768 [Nematolebias whitei]|uniref:zinc finger protein 768 n=1 Tax=Nematolebias whitei TaxID=451745 RepID=UPI00189B5B6D|nr:zinc finger protein 768 [Nematolebias whitei]
MVEHHVCFFLVLKRFPPCELKCPRGLTEGDFLNLLKSTIPGLAGGRPFTILADQGGQISPLRVESVTPEELRRTRGSTGSPVIYVQLKEKLPLTEDLRHPPGPSTPLTRVQPVRSQSAELPVEQLVELKICILDDPTIEEITPLVFQKYSIHDVQFPMYQQETQFLDSVRSLFPLLVGKDFDFLICHGNKLKPLQVQNPTPQKIKFIIRSFTGTVLYIRLKGQENVQDDAATAHSNDQTKPPTSECRQQRKRKTRVLSRKSKSLRREDETDDSLDMDHDTEAVSAEPSTLQPQLPHPSSQKMKEQSVQRPDVGANSLLDEDETEDSEDSEYDKPEPSRLWSMPPLLPQPTTKLQSYSPEPKKATEEQHVQPSEVVTNRSLEDEETEDSEDCDDDGNAVSTKHLPQQPPRSNREKQSRNPEPAKTTGQSVKPSTERQTESKDTMDAEDGSPPLLLTLLQTSNNDSDQNRNPEPVEDEQRAASSSFLLENKAPQNHEASGGVLALQYSRNPEPLRLKEPVQPSVLPNSQTSEPSPAIINIPLVPCKVCSSLRGSENMLLKHAWTHVNEQGMLCGVCGERSESTDELRRHLQAHQKTHNCTICGKSFLTLSSFRGHMNLHEGKRPYKCPTCHKTFAAKSVLNKHVQTHKGEFKCTLCHRSFSSDIRLKLHLLTHPDRKQDGAQTSAALSPAHTPAKEKRFSCEVCHKSFFTKKAFQKHAARHGTTTPTA